MIKNMGFLLIKTMRLTILGTFINEVMRYTDLAAKGEEVEILLPNKQVLQLKLKEEKPEAEQATCKDTVTGMEMILSDCSFNQACSFLEILNPGKYLGCEAFGDTTKIKFEKRVFYYDKERCCLLGK